MSNRCVVGIAQWNTSDMTLEAWIQIIRKHSIFIQFGNALFFIVTALCKLVFTRYVLYWVTNSIVGILLLEVDRYIQTEGAGWVSNFSECNHVSSCVLLTLSSIILSKYYFSLCDGCLQVTGHSTSGYMSPWEGRAIGGIGIMDIDTGRGAGSGTLEWRMEESLPHTVSLATLAGWHISKQQSKYLGVE